MLVISKSSVARNKLVECILFDLNMVGKTHWNLISSHFVAINILLLLLTSGFNMKILKINFTAFLFQFLKKKIRLVAMNNR